MSKVYIALEAMGLLVLIIVLCANIFEVKKHAKKRRFFTQILILDAIIMLADLVSWLHLGWEDKEGLLWFLVMLSYMLPFFAQAAFSRYLYEHISEKVKVSRIPFYTVIGYSLVLGIISLAFCMNGKLYTIENGIFCSGPYESNYYIIYIASLMIFFLTILCYCKKLGFHDSFAAMMYCIVPMIALCISISSLEISLGVPSLAIEALVIYIMLQNDREHKLLYQSYNDELTGVYNRRAYEDDILQFPDVPPEPDFVYVSVDVNGLKQVNDTLGHAAGDEIICGCAQCLKRTLGNHGKIYRTGGDEFVSMLFADEEKMAFLISDLEALTSQWHGNMVDELSLSVGYATKREFQTETVVEMSKIADKRMYQAKREHYSKKGIDRRGQTAAHTALCKLYTKILKVNLTEDKYSIITMDPEEQTREKGVGDTISGWLSGFGKSGQVHDEDLQTYLEKTDINYLKNYFKQGKTSISIFYKRKYEDGFKEVSMEMIPADDYTEDNQTLFMFVKTIDR